MRGANMGLLIRSSATVLASSNPASPRSCERARMFIAAVEYGFESPSPKCRSDWRTLPGRIVYQAELRDRHGIIYRGRKKSALLRRGKLRKGCRYFKCTISTSKSNISFFAVDFSSATKWGRDQSKSINNIALSPVVFPNENGQSLLKRYSSFRERSEIIQVNLF